MLDLIETAFDQMALAGEPGVVRALDLGPLMRRNDRFTALRVQVRDELRPSSLAAIRDHFLEGQPCQKCLRLGAVMALSSRQECP